MTLLSSRWLPTVIFLLLLISSAPAKAVPSYAEQTGERCVACHVGAFGPQLTTFGRQFKLNGYVLNDGKDHFPPLAAFAQFSFTHTQADQPGGAAPHFGVNDNFAVDQVSLFYAGRIADHIGTFTQVTYSGIARQFHWDNLDLRYADQGRLFGEDLVYGATFNNNPTVQDLWNTTPAWGFPYAASGLAPRSVAATLIDGGLAQTVAGLGGYGLWNDLLYLEFDAYRSLNPDLQTGLGVVNSGQPTTIHNLAGYWRAALQHSFGDHYVEFGTYGISADVFPNRVKLFGVDRITDVALDLSYQYAPSDHIGIAAYATYIHERQVLDASQEISGTNRDDTLRTARANVSVTWENTVTLNAQRFRTSGSSDAALFGTDNGSPNSSGWIGEIDFTPGGKASSPLPDWLNLKLSLQYVAYGEFNGTSDHAGDNNNLYSLLWIAVPLF